MNDKKRCSKYEMDCLKSNFHKNKNTSNGSYNQCSSWRTEDNLENQEKTKKYYLDNRDQ